MSSFLDDVNKLLEIGKGDIGRLEHIKKTLEGGKSLYVSDTEYLEKLVRQHLSNENTSEVQTMKEKPPETNEEKSSIEDVEHSQFCGNCGKKIEPKNNFCSICGFSLNQSENNPNRDYVQRQTHFQRPLEWKSVSITTILSVIIGLLGIQGVGHFYLGKIERGIGILIAPLVLLIIGISIITGAQSGLLGYSGDSSLAGLQIGAVMFAFGCIIFYIFMFFWQIIDARKICRKYNEYLANNGKTPW